MNGSTEARASLTVLITSPMLESKMPKNPNVPVETEITAERKDEAEAEIGVLCITPRKGIFHIKTVES